MIELKKMTFDNYKQILSLKCKDNQKEFVDTPAETIALAYVGTSLGADGFLNTIYYNDTTVGMILIGQAPVADYEPEELQKYDYVYRIMGFLIDEKYQHLGIGRKAFKMVLDNIKGYPLGNKIPLALECHEENKNAYKLYKSFGFTCIGKTNDHNDIMAKLPK